MVTLPTSSEELRRAQLIGGEPEMPISQEKLDTCYTPNGDTYPLCRGQEGNGQCRECNVHEAHD